MPKFRQIDLAWPMWRYPFGSGGKRVRICACFAAFISSATMSRMKSDGVGGDSSWFGVVISRGDSSRQTGEDKNQGAAVSKPPLEKGGLESAAPWGNIYQHRER